MNNKTNEEIAIKIAKIRNVLTHLEQSRVDYYNTCRVRGRVPTNSIHGGWYNSTSPIHLILLYLRLPDVCKQFCMKPNGLTIYVSRLEREKKVRESKLH